jgi:hypothetical protein
MSKQKIVRQVVLRYCSVEDRVEVLVWLWGQKKVLGKVSYNEEGLSSGVETLLVGYDYTDTGMQTLVHEVTTWHTTLALEDLLREAHGQRACHGFCVISEDDNTISGVPLVWYGHLFSRGEGNTLQPVEA